ILDNQEVRIFTVLSRGKILGWAVVLDEMGKIKPITFLVGIDNQNNVLGVQILEYRDMFGSEIKRRSFLRQFQGKSLKDSIVVGQDIDAVTGATVSSHAAASIVRKSLKVIERYNKNQDNR
ncbi:MAG: FMN-binding protein, partial [Candidatus Omnitrophota bacterium]